MSAHRIAVGKDSSLASNDVVKALENQYLCRKEQIWLLSWLLSIQYPAVPVVVHGPPNTAKSSIVRDVLSQLQTPHAIVRCKECISGRHLLESITAGCIDALEIRREIAIDRTRYAKCENLAVLLVHLQRLFTDDNEKFVLVLDGIDYQREAPATLLAAIAAFEDYIPNLSIVFVVNNVRIGMLQRPGVPHVAFSEYTRDEALSIICRHPPSISDGSHYLGTSATILDEDHIWLWSRFCETVWDSQARYIARDVIAFKEVAEKLWKPFVAPVVDGTLGPRDFSRLILANRSLFQSEDLLTENIVPRKEDAQNQLTHVATHDLSTTSKYLLCAAYLASYNPPRTDSIYFMKYTEKKRRRRGGGVAASGSRATKYRKIPRRLLAPSPFTLERLFAIFHAIMPHDVELTMDTYTQFATLSSLRLIIKAGLGSDMLDPSAKWKVNISWDYALKLSRGAGLELTDYVFEG